MQQGRLLARLSSCGALRGMDGAGAIGRCTDLEHAVAFKGVIAAGLEKGKLMDIDITGVWEVSGTSLPDYTYTYFQR